MLPRKSLCAPRALTLFLVLLLLRGSENRGFAQEVIEPHRSVKITLLQLNDVYQISPWDKGRKGGLARVATLRKRILAETPNVLFVLDGDTLSPSVASNTFKGEQMIAAWNAVGLDYATLGNHEFDFGNDILLRRMQESQFKWVCANVIDHDTGKPFGGIAPFVIRPMGGIRVGIFGVCTADTKSSSKPGSNVDFLDPIETARKTVAAMKKQGAQIIVALTHLSMREDKQLARAAPIDVICGGHEHELLESFAGRTPILKVASDARNLGRIDLNVDARTGVLESIDWQIIPVNQDIPDDPGAAAVIGEYEKKLSAALDKPVGRASVELNARSIDNRTGETNLGDFIADAYRTNTGADVAILNGGSIRSNSAYGPGVLTRRDVLSILPFENPVVKIEVTGATLRRALEHGVSRAAEDKEDGRFPQVSGLRFVFDARQPAGSRVVGITVGGKPLEEGKTYTLATNSYILAGGDGYTMFAGSREIITPEEGAVEPAVVINAIGALPSIAPATDGRIQRLDTPRPALLARAAARRVPAHSLR